MKTIFLTICFLLASITAPANTRYDTGTVTFQFFGAETETVITDSSGGCWYLYGDGYRIGDQVIMEFNTKGTEELWDDEITDVIIYRSESAINTTRYAMGEIIGHQYDWQGELAYTSIQTDDGNIWDIEDYTAPLGDRCTVVFDTRSTAEIEDDLVTGIICYSEVD